VLDIIQERYGMVKPEGAIPRHLATSVSGATRETPSGEKFHGRCGEKMGVTEYWVTQKSTVVGVQGQDCTNNERGSEEIVLYE
jgi:hypothetical protein